MITFIAALCAGFVSAVITLVFGQPLQHYFWRRQRRAERQLAIIDELTKLVAEFIYQHQKDYDTARAEGRRLQFDAAYLERFMTSLLMIEVHVEALFSPATLQRFARMRQFIGGDVSAPSWLEFFAPFRQARDHAVQAMYQEVGILAPSWPEYRRGTLAPSWQRLRACWRASWASLQPRRQSRPSEAPPDEGAP